MNEMQAKQLIYYLCYIYGLDVAKLHIHWKLTQPPGTSPQDIRSQVLWLEFLHECHLQVLGTTHMPYFLPLNQEAM